MENEINKTIAILPEWLRNAFNGDPTCCLPLRKCEHCGGLVVKFKPPHSKRDYYSEICLGRGVDCTTNIGIKKKITAQNIQDSKDAVLNGYKSIWRMSNLNDRSLLDCRFYTFDVDNEQQRKVWSTSQDVAEKMLNDWVHVVFSGSCGTGKTHLAISIANEFLEKTGDKTAIVVHWESMIRDMTDDKEDVISRAYQLYRLSKNVDLLVLDDLGLSKNNASFTGSSFQREKLSALLESRANKNLIVTTNLSSVDIERVYGKPVLSRIISNSKRFVGLKMSYQDYRQKTQ